jgi:hypothetical protein
MLCYMSWLTSVAAFTSVYLALLPPERSPSTYSAVSICCFVDDATFGVSSSSSCLPT